MTRFGLNGLADRSPRSLSGGERQRVALARSLAFEPDLLLLDEPLSALDQPTREELRVVIQDLVSGLGIPVIHVTHDRDEALSLADDLAVIVAGKLRQSGVACEVAAAPADAVVAGLLGGAELGRGAAAGGRIAVGEISIHAGGYSGAVQVFYRPEEVRIGGVANRTIAPATLTVRVERITRTLPLARVLLACDPPVTALVLRREIERLGLSVGKVVEATIPADALCIIRSPQD